MNKLTDNPNPAYASLVIRYRWLLLIVSVSHALEHRKILCTK